MYIYCKKCKIHTGNIFKKKLILISKNKIKGKLKCIICLTKRTFTDETEGEYDLESELEIYLYFLLTDIIKEVETYCLKCKKNTKNLGSKIFETKNNINCAIKM